jgi:phospholipase C
MYPCYLFKSLPDVLTQNGLTWGFYVDSDSRARRHNGLTAINSIRNDPTQWANVKTTADFITAAQNGNLPNVSWVLGKQTEHPPLTACAGENQSASYINAVMNGSDWGSTAIFVVWDEWGGFYDHMPPPQPDFVQYGFRVPFIAISPYTKAGSSNDGGYIDTTLYSHASMLAFVLWNWSLPANSLTPAVANANNLTNMFDFQRTPNGTLLGNPARSCTPLTLAEKRLYHRNPWD